MDFINKLSKGIDVWQHTLSLIKRLKRTERSSDEYQMNGCIWCKENPDWTRDWSDPSTLPWSQGRWEILRINLKNPIQGGMMSCIRHQKPQVPKCTPYLIFSMPAKRKTQTPVPFGMSNKQMKRKKPINTDLMKPIEPLTENQQELFRCYKNDQNIVAYGAAGTGKTFITLYNALRDVLDTTNTL